MPFTKNFTKQIMDIEYSSRIKRAFVTSYLRYLKNFLKRKHRNLTKSYFIHRINKHGTEFYRTPVMTIPIDKNYTIEFILFLDS